MNDGMEQAQRLTQVRGAAAMGVISVPFCFFPFLSLCSVHFCFCFCSISQVSYISGDEG